MLLNTIIGFIIPWIFGVWLYSKDRKIILLIFPFASIISHTVNGFGFTFGYWMFKPFELHAFSALPFDLGLFALSGCGLIYGITNRRMNPYVLILIFPFVITGFEYICVLSGYARYGNGWNVFYTYISYLIPFVSIYWYYLTLKRIGVL